MRILLTNDDGVASPGIILLAKALREAGHRVFVVAPDVNRSGSSHCILFFSGPLKLSQVEKDTWACSGTPVDCLIVSLLGGIPEISISAEGTDISMKNAPDLVLSGINAGANLGTDIIYSGTAAAARQGSIFGIPSIALSLVENDESWKWDTVVSFIVERLNDLKSHWKEGAFVNVNFPNNEKKPSNLVPVFPSMRYYNDRIVTYTDPEGDVYCFPKLGRADNIPDEGSDWAEVLKGNAAFSVIKAQPAVFQGEGLVKDGSTT